MIKLRCGASVVDISEFCEACNKEYDKRLNDELKESFADAPGSRELIYPSKVVPGIVYATRD